MSLARARPVWERSSSTATAIPAGTSCGRWSGVIRTDWNRSSARGPGAEGIPICARLRGRVGPATRSRSSPRLGHAEAVRVPQWPAHPSAVQVGNRDATSLLEILSSGLLSILIASLFPSRRRIDMPAAPEPVIDPELPLTPTVPLDPVTAAVPADPVPPSAPSPSSSTWTPPRPLPPGQGPRTENMSPAIRGLAS